MTDDDRSRNATRVRLAVALAVLALLAAACGGADTATTTTTAAPATTTTSTEPPSSTVAAGPDRISLDIGLPRAATYVWVETTITDAVISNVEPRTYLRNEQVVSEATYLFLTLDVANRSESDGVIINPSPFTLLIDGVPQPAPEAVDGRAYVGFAPLGAETKVLAFEVPAGTTFESLVLTIGEPDRIPAVLPLTGALVDAEFPVTIAVSGEGPARGAVSGCNQALDVTMSGAVVDIQLPKSDHAPTAYGSRRAYVGERFLSVDVSIFNNGGSRCGAGATNYDPSAFRLVVDGVAQAPVTFLSGIIAAGTAEDITIHFAYPTDATTLEFEVGSEDGDLFTTPIDVSAVPRIAGEGG